MVGEAGVEKRQWERFILDSMEFEKKNSRK